MYKLPVSPRPHGQRAAATNWIPLFAVAAMTLLALTPLWAAGAAELEMSEGEAVSERGQARADILAKTVERPGGQKWEPGYRRRHLAQFDQQ